MIQDLNEISDGKIYGRKDMVRAACNDCSGCHACCEEMGDSIVLDPFDVYQIKEITGMGVQQLLTDAMELGIVEGITLPHLKMCGEKEQCFFLNKEGRCSIHTHRPGLCRVFPLGRIYEDTQIKYFLQPEACLKSNRNKIKVAKWLDVPEYKKYDTFLLEWHGFRKMISEKIKEMKDDKEKSNLNLSILNQFYVRPYELERDFYEQFYERMEEWK